MSFNAKRETKILVKFLNTLIWILGKMRSDKLYYEGCSNMNASSFITFFTYMLRQNGKRFYKGLYVTFKLAPDLKKKHNILIEL